MSFDTVEERAALLANFEVALDEMHFKSLPDGSVTRDDVIAAILATDPALTTEEAYEWTTKIERSEVVNKLHASVWYRIVYSMKRYYHAPFTPTFGATNYLTVDEKDKSIPVSERYLARLAKIGVTSGKPVDPNSSDSIYGWYDFVMLKHLAPYGDNCAVAEVTNIDEKEWSEFTDTFADPEDGQFTGFEADAKCACGWFSSGRIRWEGSAGELLREVTKQDIFH